MSRLGLKQVFGRSAGTRALLDAVTTALGSRIAVEDLQGRLVYGVEDPAHAERVAVRHADADVGWVRASQHAGTVAHLLEQVIGHEAEKKSLGAEVLHLYREVNLIYGFSEKLAALLEVERVAHLTLQEARHLIVATDGVLMVLDDETGRLNHVAAFGDEMSAMPAFVRGEGILGTIAATGIGEVVNDVDADPRRITQGNHVKALIAAPLRVGERITGVIALGSTLPMPYTAGELKLLSTLALQAATAIENARLFEHTVRAAQEREALLALQKQTEVARAKLESELTLAARIQAALFPAALPDIAGYDLAAHNRPARQCGGDYYDAIRLGTGAAQDAVLLCVADVSGKGLPASLVMSNMQATLRALLGGGQPLPDLTARASELLYASTAPERYVTAALAELAPATGAIRFVSAGHVDTLVVRRDGTVETLASTGTPLGLIPGLPYSDTTLSLAPGDALVLFSDGVPEAQNDAGEEFGEARVVECVLASRAGGSAAVVGHLMAAIDAFTGDAPQFDDITLMVVQRQ